MGVFLALSTQAEVCKNLKITPSIISTFNKYNRATKDYENLGPEAFVNSMALTKLDSKFMISLLKGLPPLPKLSWDQKEFWVLRLRDKNKTAVLDFCKIDDNEVSVNGYKFKISEKMSVEELAQFLEPLFPKQNNIGFLLWIQNQIIPSAEAVTVMGGAMIGALAGLAGMLLMNVFNGNSSSKTQSQPAPHITVSDVGSGGSLPGHTGAGASPAGGAPAGSAPGEAPPDAQNPAGANSGGAQPNGGAAGSGAGGAKPNATPNAPSANNGEKKCSDKTTPIAGDRKAELSKLSDDQIKNFQCFSKYHEFGNSKLQVAQWNDGEDWLSLGVGHYIWYPKEGEKKYTESFPDLIKFACSNGYTGSLPKEIGYTGGNPVLGVCPWNSKKEFEDPKTKNSDELKNIQNFLLGQDMQKQQALFQYNRLLDFMDKWKPANKVEEHAKEFAGRLMQDPKGLLQMIDYVNFKGEGTAPGEYYKNNKGEVDRWGLKQVLETAVNEGQGLTFIEAAKSTLNRKINTDPKICEKHTNPEECKKDLKAGWEKRINDYSNIATAQSKYNCK